LRDVVGPQPSGWGVVDSKFSETNPILSNFYARARVFLVLFCRRKREQTNPMTKAATNILATLMLAFMVSIAFFSMVNDSTIMDEVSHLPAGYSYISQMDMRINPEHPPLVKDLAGGMIWLYSKISDQPINFPYDIPAWTTAVNGQWDFGFSLMYKMGNNANLMLLLGRLPMLLIMLLLGFYVFKWSRELFGSCAGLISLFLYSFSPTFIAHGRFVTTDVAAATAIFIASYYFIRWLKNPSARNLIIAGLVFGVAQLAKFSVFLLVILFAFVIIVWIYLKTREAKNLGQEIWSSFGKNLYQYFGGVILLFVIGYIFIVWPVYLFHIANYPVDRQVRDTQAILQSFGMPPIANLIIWMSGLPILRGLAQYGLGLAMVLQRAIGGNTTYFLGEISNTGSQVYFPVVYFLKETLTLHILTLTALLFGLWQFGKKKFYQWNNFNLLLQQNIAQVLMLGFIVLYWYSSLHSILNIGIRHLLPTFPFIFLLIAQQISLWLKNNELNRNQAIQSLKYTFLAILIVWQAISIINVYPSFLAYFNESIGGPTNGYKYVADSNLDWGQDLKRLAAWVNTNKVDKIYMDFFGGALPQYYLGDKFMPWWGDRSPEDIKKDGGWLAVSATFLQGGRGKLAPGFYDKAGYYNWLNDYKPTIIIGHSIFVYYIPPSAN